MCEMNVKHIFYIGDAVVLTGKLMTGTLFVGDYVEVYSPGKCVQTTVAGIEKPPRELVLSAEADSDIGILLRNFPLEELDDGFKRAGRFKIEVVDIKVRSAKRPWWKLW